MSDEPPFRRDALAPDAQPRLGRSLLGVASSLVTCLVLLVLMYVAVDSSFLLVLALTIPAAGPSYDEEREYGEAESATSGEESEGHESEEEREDEGPEASAEDEQVEEKQADEEADEDRESQRQRVRRFERQARASSSGHSRSSGRSRSRGSNSGRRPLVRRSAQEKQPELAAMVHHETRAGGAAAPAARPANFKRATRATRRRTSPS
jgi:hypothetical protein